MKNIIILLSTLLLSNSTMIGAAVANDDLNTIGKNHPNDRYITYKTTVVDTLEAERIFSEKKKQLMEAYHKGTARHQRCKELINLKGKKVKSEDDVRILNEAFYRQKLLFKYDESYLNKEESSKLKKSNYFLNFIPIYGAAIYEQVSRKKTPFEKIIKLKKNIDKGKLTEDVLQCLRAYSIYIEDSLYQQQKEIERGWNYWLEKDEIPHKEIVLTTKNIYYRGNKYDDDNYLDMIDKKQQKEGWEFLYSNNRTSKHDSYPQELNYYVYDAAPQYKVLYNEKEINCVYDKNGELFYVPSFTRNENSIELKDIKRAVYFIDYQNNKYGIKSQPAKTQEYLKLVLGQENGFEKAGNTVLGTVYAAAFASMAASSLLSPLEAYKAQNKAKQKVVEEALKYKDSLGEKYIEQLREDHSDEFGYVYMIERISNVSFRITYINKESLQPSHCAIVTYRTGNKPYTKMFSVKLINEFPTNIPPATP